VQSAAYTYDTTAPAPAVFTNRPPAFGSDRTISWTFVVPIGARATCTVTRDFTQVRAEGPCSGRYDLDLAGLPDGTYTLSVVFTDAAGNPSAATLGTYALRTSGLAGPVRVDPPPARPAAPFVPDVATPIGPGRGGTGVTIDPPQGSAPRSAVPMQSAEGDDVVRASQVGSTPSAQDAEQQEVAARQEPEPEPTKGSVLLPGPIPAKDVQEVFRELVTGPVTKPTLPLALLAIVLLFLLAQNRIDRRDPKLAAAPVEAEPELDFTAFVRRPGSAHS